MTASRTCLERGYIIAAMPVRFLRASRPAPIGFRCDCLRFIAAGVVAAALSATSMLAQPAVTTRVFHVRETMGIRRTEYPVSATFQLPKGALADTQHARVTTNGGEVPAQFTARATWDDGSVQTLDVDFNASVAPEEDRRYELQCGTGVTPGAPPSRGLTVQAARAARAP